jgi:hypothetical protein
MPTKANITERNGSGSLDGLTLANVDLSDRELVAKILDRDLQAADLRIKEEVRRLQDLGVIDACGRRLNRELPPDMKEESITDFGG